jgi:hypothetical protein
VAGSIAQENAEIKLRSPSWTPDFDVRLNVFVRPQRKAATLVGLSSGHAGQLESQGVTALKVVIEKFFQQSHFVRVKPSKARFHGSQGLRCDRAA